MALLAIAMALKVELATALIIAGRVAWPLPAIVQETLDYLKYGLTLDCGIC